jgi:N-acetylmuramoyl-L-alanine amidase
VSAQSPIPVQAAWLDHRAHRITDPVERLRFLRQEMDREMRRPEPARRRFRLPARTLTWAGIAALAILWVRAWPTTTAETVAQERALAIPSRPASLVAAPAAKVWRVDRSGTLETYSNGLRIDLTFAVSNRPREPYPVFPLNGGSHPVRYGTAPAGIVFHTTESHLAPFEEDENGRLKQLGRNLLEVIRQDRSYHYVIDRFGRVFRVVEESEVANHAGHSVWADSSGIYVNLNSSFLGVAFEGQTDATGEITAAQISAGRMLTEMLRSRYSIPAEDCVTHAQVSVNPVNMRIGVHTDWATQFPFRTLGLPDNYAIPLASLYAFGFGYDSSFVHATGVRWMGLDLAENQVLRQAAAEGLTPARYRAILQHRYKDITSALKQQEEDESEGGS